MLGLLCLFVAFCYQAYQNLSKNLPKPTFNSKEYWGKGKADGNKEDTSIKPFKVDYSEKVRLKVNKLVDAFISGIFRSSANSAPDWQMQTVRTISALLLTERAHQFMFHQNSRNLSRASTLSTASTRST